MYRDIKNYDVFKLSHKGVLDIYRLTRHFPSEEKFGMVSQMRRSAYSIPMNLVEGAARESEREIARFISIARGSCAEVLYQLELSKDLDYISAEEYKAEYELYDRVGRMLTNLIRKVNESAKSNMR